jgi:hypothetical protein
VAGPADPYDNPREDVQRSPGSGILMSFIL